MSLLLKLVGERFQTQSLRGREGGSFSPATFNSDIELRVSPFPTLYILCSERNLFNILYTYVNVDCKNVKKEIKKKKKKVSPFRVLYICLSVCRFVEGNICQTFAHCFV